MSATPTSGGAPANVALSGSGFDPGGGTVSCHFTTGTPASTTTLTVQAGGSASGAITVTGNDAIGTNPIVCVQRSSGGSTLTATVTFRVLALTTSCGLGPTSPAPTALTCPVDQVVGVTVVGTDLSLTDVRNPAPNATGGVNPTDAQVVMSSVVLGMRQSDDPACATTSTTDLCKTDQYAVSSGHLNTVDVADGRGDLAGWTVTGQMNSDFEGPTVGRNHTIPASDLSWVPSVSSESTNSCVTLGSAHACGPSDVLTEVSAGPTQALSTSTSAILCQAAPGGGGGGTMCTAQLALAVPPYIVAGEYTATLDVVVS